MSGFLQRVRFGWDHRWAPRRMSDYLDEELASTGKRRMERHVGRCEECRRLLAGLRGMLDALHRPPARIGADHALRMAASVRGRLSEPPAS